MQAAFQKGDAIYKPGEVAHALYFIVSGRVLIKPSRGFDLEQGRGRRISNQRGRTEDEDVMNEGESTLDDAGLLKNFGMWSASDGEIFGERSHEPPDWLFDSLYRATILSGPAMDSGEGALFPSLFNGGRRVETAIANSEVNRLSFD